MAEVTIELPGDINKLCRTCMGVIDHIITQDNLLLIEAKRTNTCEMLANITNLEILPSDGLPESVCQQCFYNLQALYLFKEQCISTERNLKNLIAQSKETCEENINLNTDFKSENIYFCSVCLQSYNSYYSLTRHAVIHDSNKSIIDRYLGANIIEDNVKLSEIPSNKLKLVKQRKIEATTSKDKEYVKTMNQLESIYIYEENPVQVKDIKSQVCPICDFKYSKSEEDTHNCADVIEETLRLDLNDTEKLIDSVPKVCDLCDRTFNNDVVLSLHFLKHALMVESETDPKIFSQYIFCDLCGMAFDLQEELNEHLTENHQDCKTIVWECEKCKIYFPTELDLLSHDQEMDHYKNGFWSDFVNKESTKCSYKCPMCEEAFTTKLQLNTHSVLHATKKIKCRTCKALFCTDAAYNAHLPLHPSYTHMCNICGKHLSSKATLKIHIMGIHSNQKPYICQVCAKPFKTPNRLHHHKLIHRKTKQFVCSYCGYRTHKGGDLTVHVRTHTEERPYKCSYVNCGRSFKTSSHRSEHVRRHLQIKRYNCNICNLKFGHLFTLKTHLMQHTGEKPFRCELCNSYFRRKHHLKNHMKHHTKE